MIKRKQKAWLQDRDRRAIAAAVGGDNIIDIDNIGRNNEVDEVDLFGSKQ